jgi:hypothetical protein
MNPWKVSAQFAAYVWYLDRNTEKTDNQQEAARFAKDNWIAFLPYAHEGVGRLLIKVGAPRTRRVRSKIRRPLKRLAQAAEADAAVA